MSSGGEAGGGRSWLKVLPGYSRVSIISAGLELTDKEE